MLFSNVRNSRSVRLLGLIAVALLLAATAPDDLRADTTLDSGTTTVSTGTDFGANLYVATTGTATLEVVAGGIAASGSSYLGYNAGSNGTVMIGGGTWATSGSLYVGVDGNGTFNVVDGSVSSVNYDYIGYGSSGNGTVTVSGGVWNQGFFNIGYYGSGALNVSGGIVGSNFGCTLGSQPFSIGSLTITGGTYGGGDFEMGVGGIGLLNVGGGVFGSRTARIGGNGFATVSSGTWSAFNYLFVGNFPGGHGRLSISGGYVTTPAFAVGTEDGTGTVTITGGTLAQSGQMTIGASATATGTLNVSGGSVSSVGAYFAAGGGKGDATVSSGTWVNDGDLYLGNIGAGTVTVSGGYVTSRTGYLGVVAGGIGNGIISSGTWANSGDLTVGVAGTGTLTMTGGLFSVAGTLSKGTFGTINLNSGGTLQIGVGGTTGVLGVSTLTNNGTLIFNRSDAHTYSGILSGSGAVTKQGAGQLTFGGANSYLGLTTISGGTIALSGAGSIGTGGLSLGTGGVFDITALASSTYSLPATGNLTGAGTLVGTSHTLAVFGSFLPGSSAGTVTVGTGLTLDLTNSGSSTFQIASPSYTAGTFDLVNGDGSVLFGGVLNLDFSGGAYANGVDVLRLFTNTGGLSGGFSEVNFSGLGAGQSATFNPATGFISLVPEPSTFAPLAAGLVFGCWHVTRRHRVR